MKAKDVKIGRTYAAKVSGSVVPVRLTAEHPTKGWNGVNTRTGRTVRIVGAQRLRHEIQASRPAPAPPRPEEPLHAAYARLKAEDPGRVLLLEADTGLNPTIIVFNGDIAAIEAAGVPIPACDRAEGVDIVVASIPRDRLEAVTAAVAAAGGRIAVVRRVVDEAGVRSEVR